MLDLITATLEDIVGCLEKGEMTSETLVNRYLGEILPIWSWKC